MDTKLSVHETFDAGLEAVLEAILAGGDGVVEGAAGEVATSKNQGVHLGMNREVVLHGALGEGHLGFVGPLEHTIITERHDTFVDIHDDAAVFGGRVFAFPGGSFSNIHEVAVPFELFLFHNTSD